MSIESSMVATLQGSAAVVAIADRRIWPQMPSQEALDAGPVVVYRRLATPNPFRVSVGTLSDEKAEMQVDCVSDDQATSRALGDATESALLAMTTVDCSRSDKADDWSEGSTGDSTEGMYIDRRQYTCWTV